MTSSFHPNYRLAGAYRHLGWHALPINDPHDQVECCSSAAQNSNMVLMAALKALLTALVVVSVTKMVERFGPRLGGIISGAPIILGPGYFFIAIDNSAYFVQQSAVSSINAISATVAFTTIYILVAPFISLACALLLSSLGWLLVISVLLYSVDSIVIAAALFAVLFLLARWLMAQVNRHTSIQPANKIDNWILWRGLAAGALVGIGTSLSGHTGPLVFGAIIGFPVATTTIIIGLHCSHGCHMSRAAVSSSQNGLLSLFAFLIILGSLADKLPTELVFILAISASLLTTSAFVAFELFSSAHGNGRK